MKVWLATCPDYSVWEREIQRARLGLLQVFAASDNRRKAKDLRVIPMIGFGVHFGTECAVAGDRKIFPLCRTGSHTI